MNCEICDKGITKKNSFDCHYCRVTVCDNCITKNACSDCGVKLCKNCYQTKNGESICGCYGSCNSCGADVNRGSDGWPCYKCKKWYCNECKCMPQFNQWNKCKECNVEND